MRNNSPYKTPDSKLIPESSQNCPNCEEAFVLSWKKYFNHPFGGHECDNCGTKLKLERTLNYKVWHYSWILLLIIGGGIILTIFSNQEESNFYFDIWFIFMLTIYFPIDKTLEEKLSVVERRSR